MVTRSARRRGKYQVRRWEPGYERCWCGVAGHFRVKVGRLTGWTCAGHSDPATWPDHLPVVIV